jgi:hypothetical protein
MLSLNSLSERRIHEDPEVYKPSVLRYLCMFMEYEISYYMGSMVWHI